MIKDKIKLSPAGEMLLKEAVKRVKKEIKKFTRMRTCFYYPINNNRGVQSIELREFIDKTIENTGLKSPYQDRDPSLYKDFVHNKFFDVLSIQLHRLNPEYYLVATQNLNGKPIFIIRDKSVSAKTNIRITWDNLQLKDGSVEPVSFHLSKNQLE